MKISSYADKVGGFVATNTGVIEDCYAETKTHGKSNVAGFVYENMGKIRFSITKSKVKADKNMGQFFFKNKGDLEHCTWIDLVKRKGNVDEKEAKEAPSPTFAENEKIKTITENIPNLKADLNLGEAWEIGTEENAESIALKEMFHQVTEEGEEIVEISDSETLFRISAEIASGDVEAANKHYKLTENINLHGKKWLPMGLSETCPFTGIFDGQGFKIHNYSVHSSQLDLAGFFGYIKNGKVFNLNLDCEINCKNSGTSGSLAAVNEGGTIINCHVRAKVSAEKCFGGFVGRNNGTIIKSSFVGKVSYIIPIILLWLPATSVALAALMIGSGIMIHNFTKPVFNPSIIDPNQKPIVDDNVHVDPPPAGSNRISFELNQEVYVNVKTQVGAIGYTNPRRSTQDVVISVRISDAEIMKVTGKTGRPQKEIDKIENYDPKTQYQELYRSGRLQIGYQLENMMLSKLHDGTYLPVGDYEMIVVIDAYNPKTQEKSVVSARAPITVHIVESKK